MAVAYRQSGAHIWLATYENTESERDLARWEKMMTKRPTWVRKPTPYDHKRDQLFGEISVAETYRSFGVDADTCQWIEAIHQVDQEGETANLLDLLRSTTPITKTARSFIADLIERHTLTRRRGNQRIPAYATNPTELAIIGALYDVEILRMSTKWQQKKLRPEDAIAEVSEESGVPFEVLFSAFRGTRKTTNEAFKNLGWMFGDLKITRAQPKVRAKTTSKRQR